MKNYLTLDSPLLLERYSKLIEVEIIPTIDSYPDNKLWSSDQSQNLKNKMNKSIGLQILI